MAGRGQAPSRPRNMRHTLRVLLNYMGHARTRLAVVAVLVTVSGLANLLGTYMIKPVVNAVGAGDFSRFSRLVALTACIYAVGVASAVGYTQTMVRAAQKVVFDIRRDLLAHIEGLPLSFFDSTRHGDVMSYFTNDVDTVSEALNNSFASAVQALIQTVGTFTLLVVLDWRLTLITLACDVLIACYVRFSGGRSRRYFGAQQATLGQLDGYVEEMMAGQKVVKVFNHEDASQADFDGLNEALRQSGTTAQAYASTMVPVTVAVSYMNFAVVCVVGALLALGGRADVGEPCELPGVCPPGLHAHQPAHAAGQLPAYGACWRRANLFRHGEGARGGRGPRDPGALGRGGGPHGGRRLRLGVAHRRRGRAPCRRRALL